MRAFFFCLLLTLTSCSSNVVECLEVPDSMGADCNLDACCESTPDGMPVECWYEAQSGKTYPCRGIDCNRAAKKAVKNECKFYDYYNQ